MFKVRPAACLVAFVLAMTATTSAGPALAASKAEIDREVAAAVSTLHSTVPEARQLSKQAKAVRVTGPGPDVITPCGGCRQKLREFSIPEELVSIAGDPGGIRQRWTLAELLPHSFGPAHLNI